MGVAEIDENAGDVIIKALCFCYGDAATPTLADEIATGINEAWSLPEVILTISQKPFHARMQVEGVYKPQLQPVEVYENVNPYYNYFRIEEFAHTDISFVDGIGSNTGYFKLANLSRGSTTAAHEFGHTLGLYHPENLDLRNADVPGIMYPRGTLTIPQYQYDPAAPAGQIGGTMNPIHRRVSRHDWELLKLDKLRWQNNKATVGAFSSVWHTRHQ